MLLADLCQPVTTGVSS